MRVKSSLPSALKYHSVIIEQAAREAGLDFFEVVFELLEANQVNAVAAYGGFPVRYPSWRHGMEYDRLEKGYRWGLSKIYELVINNDPTYAYLVASNSLLEQKLVMAHVFGHADFFKHNAWFAPTNRRMLDTMADHSIRLRRYIDAFGLERVERFLDLALSVDTLIDPYLPARNRLKGPRPSSRQVPLSERTLASLDALSESPLDSQGKLAGTAELAEAGGSSDAPVYTPWEVPTPQGSGALPTYDILGFLVDHAPVEPWQRDVLRIVRREAYYFSPQRLTKVMNEGWASYWHSKLLTGGLLEPSEIVDFADCHSSATSSAPGQLNPYKLGIELFRHAEARGEDIFRLRAVHKDVSFLHKLVDQEFCERHLVTEGAPPEPEDSEGPGEGWERAKAKLLTGLSWGGLPQIELIATDATGDGELLLLHHHDGRDLKLEMAQETLLTLARLWGKPVHLLTQEEKRGKRLVCDGEKVDVLDTAERLEAVDAEA